MEVAARFVVQVMVAVVSVVDEAMEERVRPAALFTVTVIVEDVEIFP